MNCDLCGYMWIELNVVPACHLVADHPIWGHELLVEV